MNFVKTSVLDNAFEAGLLEAILVEQGIPHHIRSYSDDVYGSLYQTTKGWGAVYAPEAHRQAIEQLLVELREQPQAESDEWSE